MALMQDVCEQNLDRLLGFQQGKNSEAEYTHCFCWVGVKDNNPNNIIQWLSNLPELTYQHQPNRLSDSYVDWELITKVQQASRTRPDDYFTLASQVKP